MKQKELNNLRSKDLMELKKIVQEKNVESIKSKAETKVGKEKNLKKSANIRRDMAQILTIMREKELINKVEE